MAATNELPRIIGKIEELPEELRGPLQQYYAAGTGEYSGKLVLLGTDPGVAALQRVNEHEKTQRREATERAAEFEARIKELEKKSNDGGDKGDKKKTSSTDNDALTELHEKLESLQVAYDRDTKDLKKQIETEREARTGKEKELTEREHRESMRAAAKTAGASDEAVDDVVGRMSSRMVERDGKRIPVKEDGKSTLYGIRNNPTEPMSLEELASDIVEKNTHLQRRNRGAGSNGGEGTSAGAGTMAGGTIVLSRDEAKNPEVYRRAVAQAEKEGKTVVREDRA